MPGGEIPPRRRALAAELRRLRLESGLSQDQLAAELNWSRTQVVKREMGLTMATARDVEAWATATRAPRNQVAVLVEMANQTRVEALALRGRTVAGLQHQIRVDEGAIRSLHTFTPTGIPGLLQTRAYMEATFATGVMALPLTEEGVQGRLARQGVLHDESKTFEFVIGEAAIRHRFGPPEVHLAQLERLRIMGSLPNVSLGILPVDTRGPLWWRHEINLFEGEDQSYAGVETLTAVITVTDPDDLDRFRRAFAALRDAARFDAAGLAILDDIVADVRRGGAGSAF